jgi:hypothetical protein
MRHISRWLTLALLIAGVNLWLGNPTLYGGSSLVVGPNVKVIHDHNNQPCPSANDLGPSFDCDNLQQNEPTIAVDPTNPNILVAGSNDYRLEYSDKFSRTIWMGYYRSTDGGVTWVNSFIPGFPGDASPQGQGSPLQGVDGLSDPVVAFDRQGNVFYLSISVPNEFGFGNSVQQGVYVARYSDHGATYDGTTAVSVVPVVAFSDKPCMAVDTSGGPHDGSIYVGWTRDPAVILFSRSTDHGKTFSPAQVVLAPKISPSGVPAEARGCTITTDGKGNVYMFWRDQNICDFNPGLGSFCQAIAGDQPEAISMAASYDGGASFLAVFPIQQIHRFDQVDETETTPPNFRHRSFPTAASDGQNVYIVWEEQLVGQGGRVVISCSSDQGFHWQTPVTVDPAATGHQVMPTITAADGLVKVAWYDSRNDPNFSPTSPLMNRLDVYYAETQAGCPVHVPAASIRVTDKSFDPNLKMFRAGTVPFIGDYISITSAGGKAHVIWTDNRDVTPQPVTNPPCDPKNAGTLFSGCRNQNIYTATITEGH